MEIKSLKEELSLKEKLEWEKPYYWLVYGEHDESKDGPFCQHCFDKEKSLVRLQGNGGGYSIGWWECKVCKNTFTDKSYNEKGLNYSSVGQYDPYI